jgi:flagella basal body P-ring formation protein FlgA
MIVRSLLVATAVLVVTFLPAYAAPAQGRATAQAARPVQPPPQPTLKADITATRDILTLGDLVANLPARVAEQPAFRAPALGDTGTIQTHRILEALRAQGVETLVDGGAAQLVVTRSARRVGMPEIEGAMRRAVEERHGVDVRSLSLTLDNGAPTIILEPELRGQIIAQDLVYDPRSRRVAATLMVPGSSAMRLKPVRVAGQMVDTIEVITPLRAVNRGELLQAGDISIERRPRDGALADLVTEASTVIGKAARRALNPGQPIRAADLQRQEIIARNEMVSVIFESPGLVLSMRGRAQEAGAQGDVINVQNIQSKKIVQATVVGPGRVTVNPGATGRVASAN